MRLWLQKTKIIIDLTRSIISWQLLHYLKYPAAIITVLYFYMSITDRVYCILFSIMKNLQCHLILIIDRLKIFFLEGKPLDFHQYHLDLW